MLNLLRGAKARQPVRHDDRIVGVGAMERTTGRTLLSLFGGSLVLLPVVGSEQAIAQQEIRLFDEIPAESSGFPTTSVSEAGRFNVTNQEVTFDPDVQSAHISGGPDLLTPFAIDNFMTINGTCAGGVNNICAGRTDDSCFGEGTNFFLARRLELGEIPPLDMDAIFERIPPVNVSDFIPSGTSEVRFTLCDFGAVFGNTDLFLVIRDVPQCSRSQCEMDAEGDRNAAIGQCVADAEVCDASGGIACFDEQEGCVRSANEALDTELRSCEQCRLP